MKSILQDEKRCYVTGAEDDLHKHHIFAGAANRKLSEKYGCWVYLRSDWHNGRNYGVHYNRALELKLKRDAQKRFEELHGHEKFMEVFGKSWL